MNRELKRVKYRSGMLENGIKPKNLPIKIWNGIQISEEVRKAIEDENLMSLGGVFGDRNAGDPIEYDHLTLIDGGETVEITVFNRGIALFTQHDERIRRIHRVLARLDKK